VKNVVQVALLRGINVGGNNKLPMKELAAMFRDAGAVFVDTYIQSGNVVYEAPPARARALPSCIARELEALLGKHIPVVFRTPAEMNGVAKSNPYLASGADPTRLHVAFLADEPTAPRIARLDPRKFAPDSFTVRGRELYLHFPAGVAKTKLTNVGLDRELATTSTIRNWRTVLALCERARAREKLSSSA
jgi:uncharacterized protein (DUF1697 family)